MPKMELDKLAKAQPAERTEGLANPQNPEKTNLYTVARQKFEAERAAPAMAPAEPPARARAQMEPELTPELRQSNLEREIGLADARVAELDEQLKPNKVKAEAERIVATQITLEHVRADPAKYAMLQKQAKNEFVTENLEFLEATERNPRSKKEAKAIYEKFIKANADAGKFKLKDIKTVARSTTVNVSSQSLKGVEARLKNWGIFSSAKRNEDIFAQSRNDIKNLVSNDVLPRLKRDPQFRAQHIEPYAAPYITQISNDLQAQKIEAVRQRDLLKTQLLTEQLQNGQ